MQYSFMLSKIKYCISEECSSKPCMVTDSTDTDNNAAMQPFLLFLHCVSFIFFESNYFIVHTVSALYTATLHNTDWAKGGWGALKRLLPTERGSFCERSSFKCRMNR